MKTIIGLLIMLAVVALAVYGIIRLIKWAAKPSCIYKFGNHIYVAHGKLSREQQIKVRNKFQKQDEKRKRK